MIEDEVERAAATLVPGAVVDIYDWVRHLALRVAMRALFGLDPDRARAGGFDAVDEFEAALSFHARSVAGQVARGPGSPYDRVRLARRRLDELLTREIDARRAGDRPRRGPALAAGAGARRGRRPAAARARSATRS